MSFKVESTNLTDIINDLVLLLIELKHKLLLGVFLLILIAVGLF